MKLSFVGDIMLGRFVRDKWNHKEYNLFSDALLSFISKSDYVFANLESPVTDIESQNSLAFAGDKRLLSQCKWIDCFSLSNNHINDFGREGIEDTISNLNANGLEYNGIITRSDTCIKPVLLEKDGNKIAVVTCTDMLNYEFDDDLYRTVRMDTGELNDVISDYTSQGYFVILFAHCGSLFSRFPNPQIKIILHSAIDAGAKCIVTAHSHCLGGQWTYKGVPVFYSLGDFLMDGASYRRRQSCVLTLSVIDNKLINWKIKPTVTDNDLATVFPDNRKERKMLKSFEKVSYKIQQANNYEKFYSKQYKREMLYHSISSLYFLYDTKGFKGFFKMLKVRSKDVKMMLSRMIKGRNNMRYDADAVGTGLKNSDIK